MYLQRGNCVQQMSEKCTHFVQSVPCTEHCSWSPSHMSVRYTEALLMSLRRRPMQERTWSGLVSLPRNIEIKFDIQKPKRRKMSIFPLSGHATSHKPLPWWDNIILLSVLSNNLHFATIRCWMGKGVHSRPQRTQRIHFLCRVVFCISVLHIGTVVLPSTLFLEKTLRFFSSGWWSHFVDA